MNNEAVAAVSAAIDEALEFTKAVALAGGSDEDILLEQARAKLAKAGVAAIEAFQAYQPPVTGPRIIR